MEKKITVIVMLFAVLFFGGCGSSGSTDTAWINVPGSNVPKKYNLTVVRQDTGKAIEGVSVTFVSGTGMEYICESGPGGLVPLGGIPGGEYDVECVKWGSGYDRLQRTVTLPLFADEKLELEFSLMNRVYGGSNGDEAISVIRTSDGCLVFVVNTDSGLTGQDGDVPQIHSGELNSDVWLVKVDPAKADEPDKGIVFSHVYGGSDYDLANSVIETSDGCLVFAGSTYSGKTGKDGDVPGNYGRVDAWLVKVNPSKENRGIEFSQIYGGSDGDNAHSVIETSDGCLVFVGNTSSGRAGKDGDVPQTLDFEDNSDVWLVKVDPAEATEPGKGIVFAHVYGGSAYDDVSSLIKTSDGCLVFVGKTNSGKAGQDYDVPQTHSNSDAWLVKVSPSKEERGVIFVHTYGGDAYDEAKSIIETSDGCLVFVGMTASGKIGLDYDVPQAHGNSDAWLVKVNPSKEERGIVFSQVYGGRDNDSARSVIETSDGYLLFAGMTNSGQVGQDGDVPGTRGDTDAWLVKVKPSKEERGVVFSQVYGGSAGDGARAVVEMSDGCFVFMGITNSGRTRLDYDVPQTYGSFDVWFLQVDIDGNYDI